MGISIRLSACRQASELRAGLVGVQSVMSRHQHGLPVGFPGEDFLIARMGVRDLKYGVLKGRGSLHRIRSKKLFEIAIATMASRRVSHPSIPEATFAASGSHIEPARLGIRDQIHARYARERRTPGLVVFSDNLIELSLGDVKALEAGKRRGREPIAANLGHRDLI